ncbi:hypothetical protein U1Q18_027024 [Sarracenia purpurea var. burkii]
MATSANSYPQGLTLAVTLILIISSFTFLPSKSAGLKLSISCNKKLQQEKIMVLGSRPPVCENKCKSCRPCMAALVIPPHNRKGFTESCHYRDDGSYYVLSWKCRCRGKLYQP